MTLPARRPTVLVAFVLLGLALWLRWPTFGFSLWNLDEAIHAAAARTLLDGGVLYRDAIDQRTPLSYHAVAAIFAVAGENNLWAVRAFIALLVGATSWLLFRTGRTLRDNTAAVAAALLYVLLATSTLSQGDANAANTEWFVAFFSSAAAMVFLGGGITPHPRRLFVAGLLLGCSFLSKQPALLDLAAPLVAMLYTSWQQRSSKRQLLTGIASLSAGWLCPVLLTAGYFAVHGALRDAVFYTWTYNLAYYGPEIDHASRLASAMTPFKLIGGAQPWLLLLWLAGALAVMHRLLQRQPKAVELAGNPGLTYLSVWSLAGIAGAASGGRDFDHYIIQFLAPFCLGAGLVLAHITRWTRPGAPRPYGRILAACTLVVITYDAITTVVVARRRTLPDDSSLRVSAYIREHSNPDERIFVWGYHPDIYLHSDRQPASRFLYASFITGLIPWTNTAPDRDTNYAIVPGTMDALLDDLTRRLPVFIVDCSAGPNRHWQKYPLDNFPRLRSFIVSRYRLAAPHQFVPQGFRLYRLRDAAEPADELTAPPLPAEVANNMRLSTAGTPLRPVVASARHGANVAKEDGRIEYFVHAPSSLVYELPSLATALRGGFGIWPGAYAEENQGPTDGAEFVVRWRPAGGGERVLFRRLLQPRESSADRGLQSFRVELPPYQGGELELAISAGPNDNSASDWTFWTDLVLENSR